LLTSVDDPAPPADGVVIAVAATGVCRSDWHGWMGHDPDIVLPHVPGHEFAGTVVAVGANVRGWLPGARVTAPFIAGCGVCAACRAGDQQVCPNQTQPGFTHWGSFAEFVVVRHADHNLVALPDGLDAAAAASLGCRFATSFRAIVDQGAVRAGEWVAVHGCGGVGLSAVMIAHALGANVIAVDVQPAALELARSFGAAVTVDGRATTDVAAAVRDASGGGAHVSLDALGDSTTCVNSVLSLRPRGRHVQVGLLLDEHATPPIPMGRVVAQELQILGSHGMQAHRYDAMLAMITAGTLQPERLVGRTIGLEDAVDALVGLDTATGAGVTVVEVA
jgi:alcohol dehydrogenase